MGWGLAQPWSGSPLLGSRTARVYSNPVLEVARTPETAFLTYEFRSARAAPWGGCLGPPTGFFKLEIGGVWGRESESLSTGNSNQLELWP